MKPIVNTLGMLGLAGLPFGITESMWAEPSLRGYARSFDGSAAMWVVFSIYYLTLLALWMLKNAPPPDEDESPRGEAQPVKKV